MIGGLTGVEASKVRYRGQEVTLKSGTDRFVLPPDFRKQVRHSSAGDRILCLSLHDTIPALVGFGFSREDDFADLIELEAADAKAAGKAFDRQRRWSQLTPGYTTPFDDSGRFVLPGNLLRHTKITDRIYFHSAGPEFLILSPDVVDRLGDDWSHLKIGCEGALERLKPARAGK